MKQKKKKLKPGSNADEEMLNRIYSYYDCNYRNLIATSYARAGFHYVAGAKHIECSDCGLSLSEPQDSRVDPVSLHQSHQPKCTFQAKLSQAAGGSQGKYHKCKVPLLLRNFQFPYFHNILKNIPKSTTEKPRKYRFFSES